MRNLGLLKSGVGEGILRREYEDFPSLKPRLHMEDKTIFSSCLVALLSDLEGTELLNIPRWFPIFPLLKERERV